jgi:serine/threonine protein kinase
MQGGSDLLAAGEVLAGRYRIGHLIGSGGYGRVYRATDLHTSSPVAVKVIHGIDDELRARFTLEAGIVQKLESPHTVRLIDHGEALGKPYMVLELLQGTSVFDVLSRDRTLSPRIALEITAQLLDSLAEAHAMGIVHRDIKPENVFVTSQMGQPTFAKLLDFGIAKHGSMKKLTLQGQVVGTPSYMAPEQTSGGDVDARTDLYAIGLLLAEMVTGRTVMGTGGPITIMVAQAKREPVPLGDDVRRSIVGPVVERAVRKERAERYQSATDMLVDVRAVLADVNATSIGPTRVADSVFGPVAAPTSQGIPAHHTVASLPAPLAAALAASEHAARAPHPSPPQISPAPRPAKTKGGPLGVPLAIVAAAALASIAIVVLATRSNDDDDTHHTDRTPRDDEPLPNPKIRRPKTLDVVEIRRILVGAGYSLAVDAPSGNGVHTFAPVKLPCAGSIVVMPMQSEAMARTTADAVVSGTSGAVAMVEGRTYVSVGIARSGGSSIDARCTDDVVALLAR